MTLKSIQKLDRSTSTPIDLRSDTVTRPTAAMYERMQTAPIGDDGLDGDPSVDALQEEVAARLGKQAGLFVPSCTMANLLAVLAQGGRNEQVVLEASAHMHTSERGSASFAGMFYLAVPGSAGAMDLGRLEEAVQAGSHKLTTAVVAVETSHNNAGGAVLPIEHMRAVHTLAAARGIPVHLDGARLFNAAVALGVEPVALAQHAETVSLCLSKGLSAPVGAVLAGSHETIAKAHRLRRMLGGAQRQAGIMAAAGLEAVQQMGPRLVEDHVRARRFAEIVNAAGSRLRASTPQTNIVMVDVSATGRSPQQWVDALADVVKLRPWGNTALRVVTHRHIDDADIERAAMALVDPATGHG